MANKISIIIEAQNKASAPINKVKREVKSLGLNLKEFNRNLFATTAVVGTFMVGMSKAIESSKIGAQFGFIRTQFQKTFGAGYLADLQKATRGTVDAMTLMESALRLDTAGIGKGEISQLVKMASLVAKLRPEKDPAQVVNELSEAYRKGTPEAFANYFAQLKLSNGLQIQQKMLRVTIKGWGDASRQMALTRRYEMKLMTEALEKAAITGGDMLDVLRRTAASFKNLRMQGSEFLAQAIVPMGSYLSDLAESAFTKLYDIMSRTDTQTVHMRKGWIDLIKVVTGLTGVLTGLWTGMVLVNFALKSFGITLGTFTGGLMLASFAIAMLKDKTQSWGEFLADLGTILKAAWEAFSTYHDGVITLSGDVYARLDRMGFQWQNIAMTLIKGAALIKEGLMGAAEGFMFIYNGVVKVLRIFGLFADNTKQMSSLFATLAKWIGRVGGALAAIYAVKLAKDALMGGLSKIPGLGWLGGGGKGGKGTKEDPMYVKNVDGIGVGSTATSTIMSTLFPTFTKWFQKIGGIGKTIGGWGTAAKQGIGNVAGNLGSKALGALSSKVTLGMPSMMSFLGTSAITTVVTTVLAVLAAGAAITWAIMAAKKAWKGDFTGAAAPGGAVGDAAYRLIHGKPGEERSLLGKMDKETTYEGGAGAKKAMMDAMTPVFQGKVKIDEGRLAAWLRDGTLDSKEQTKLLAMISGKLDKEPEPWTPRRGQIW